MTDVFISSSPSDRSHAEYISKQLENAGLSVRRNQEGLRPGENWAEEIERAITNSKNFLILLSDNTPNDPFCLSRTALALTKENTRVIPILLTKYATIPFMLRSLLYLDLSDKNTRKEQLIKLIHDIQQEKPTSQNADKQGAASLRMLQADHLALSEETLSQRYIQQERQSRLIRLSLVTAITASLSAVTFAGFLSFKLALTIYEEISVGAVFIVIGLFSAAAILGIGAVVYEKVREFIEYGLTNEKEAED